TAACASLDDQNSRMIPDGTRLAPTSQPTRTLLAYMDTAHIGAATEESWRTDGTMGLAMGMMRHGYLVLTLSDFTYERISKAAVVLSVAPNRSFSADELGD